MSNPPSPEPTPTFEGTHTASTSMSSQNSPGGAGSSAATQLESLDWKDLERRFTAKMAEYETEEAKIYEDFNEWIRLFQAWASTAANHEHERAGRRLRTRIGFVQGSEARLEEKREHHQKVVEAFESALKLLGE